jgi:hypothetical protein
MSNPPAKLDLVIYQGVPFDESFYYLAGEDCDAVLPVDLTGCTADLTARHPDDLPTDPPRVHLTTANGGIFLNEEPGLVRFYIADTSAFDWIGAAGHDLDITFPNRPARRLAIGGITVSKEYRA